MNIRTDYLEALKRLEPQPQKPASVSGGEGFAALFSQEIGRPDQAATLMTAPGVRAGSIDPALFVNTLNGTEQAEDTEDANLLDALTGQASGLLDSWDSYAGNLAKGASSRTAWTALSGMDSQLQALRGALPGLSKNNPGLESVVNELEIMTATEKFKFNRGDYV
ncbi:MAG: hypothetical protein RR317_06585 [Bilophila sp.]